MLFGQKIDLLVPPLVRGGRVGKKQVSPIVREENEPFKKTAQRASSAPPLPKGECSGGDKRGLERGDLRGKNLGKTNSEQGLTLTEVLAAVVMVSIALAAMSPPLLVAMATRIQARRAEQAMNIARQEIEQVRQMVEDGNYLDTYLPSVASVSDIDKINEFSAPTTICTSSCSATQAFKEYVENDYFLVQVFRTPGAILEKVGPNKTNQTVAFRLGVRVYHRVAEKNLGSLEKDKIDVVGVANNQAGPSKAPLVVLYADLVRPNLDRSLDAYKDLLD